MINEKNGGIWWIENWQGKLKLLEKSCPSATFSPGNAHELTWV
jgi:hypothetical protein